MVAYRIRQTFFAIALVLATALTTRADAAPKEPQPIQERLINFYGKRSNYRSVQRRVLEWHKTSTNGCVAYLSTALRKVGVDVPLGEKLGGFDISRITFAFSEHLESQGWTRSTDPDKVRPGDLVFTAGYPDHVFVFDSWIHRRKRIARVIDNQGFRTRRAFFPKPGHKHSAFAYLLLPPQS